jgi:hypothetical protein
VLSLSGPSPAGIVAMFYCLRFETPPTWRARSPYLYPPGRGCSGYTPRHRVPFSSPPTTSRATVEVCDPALREILVIVSRLTHRKHRFLYCCVLIHCCRDMFTAQLFSNEHSADLLRTSLATPLLLLRDVTAYVTRSSAVCVRAIT